MEVFTDYPSQSADSGNNRNRKMGAARGRSEKSAIRVCGDWSEQLSSKGKIYFYNCVTEVSQWQKPSEWKLPDLDPEELLRRLGDREPLLSDGKNSKRPRITSSVNSNHIKDSVESRRSPPKRGRCCIDTSSRVSAISEKFSTMSRAAGSTDDVSCRYQRLRLSPKRSCDRGFQAHGSEPSTRRFPQHAPPRLFPTDDMEISPDSSPLSNGSSPFNMTTTKTSPPPSKCMRMDTHVRSGSHKPVYNPLEMHMKDTREATSTSGTLRQLVDAIRASIGGLLDRSPSTFQKPSTSGSPSRETQREIHCQSYVPHADICDRDTKHIYEPKRKLCSPDVPLTERTPTSNDPSYNHVDNCPPNHLLSSGPSQEGLRLNSHAKNIPGLVSTLTTLVTLIGNSKYPDIPATDSPLVPTPSTPISTIQRTPTHFFPSQTRVRLGSPVNHSPLTPHVPGNCVCATSGNTSHSHPTSTANPISTCVVRHVGTFPSSLDMPSSHCQILGSKAMCEYYPVLKPATSLSDTLDNATSHSDYSTYDVLSHKGGSIDFFRHQVTDDISGSHLNSSKSDDHVLECSRVRSSSNLSSELSCLKHAGGSCKSPCFCRNGSALFMHTNSDLKDVSLDGFDVCISPRPPMKENDRSTAACDVPESFKSKEEPSPCDHVLEDECLENITEILNSSATQAFVDSSTCSKFYDKTMERIEHEALLEAKKFEKLQSVLYGELSAESKKLRALVRISEAKLAIHREKQTSLQELMDAIESRKQLPNLSFSDEVL